MEAMEKYLEKPGEPTEASFSTLNNNTPCRPLFFSSPLPPPLPLPQRRTSGASTASLPRLAAPRQSEL